MIDVTLRTTDETTVRTLDGLVVAWIVLWLVVGGWFAYSTWHLADLGDTVTTSGGAIESTGRALESLAGVPVVGDKPAELGAEVAATGAEVSTRGQEVKAQLRQTAVLLGIAIAVMPTTPIVGLYLPLRLARRREVAAMRKALTDFDGQPAFERYLAEQALRTMPFATVRSVLDASGSDAPPVEPWVRTLADTELARLGLRRRGP